jgi:hypothetical protein
MEHALFFLIVWTEDVPERVNACNEIIRSDCNSDAFERLLDLLVLLTCS